MKKNKIFTLEGRIFSDTKKYAFGRKKLNEKESLTSVKVQAISSRLDEVAAFWTKISLLGGALVSIHYDTIVPKGKRISRLLKEKSFDNVNDYVVGARYSGPNNKPKHVITYFVSVAALMKSAALLKEVASYIDSQCKGIIDDAAFAALQAKQNYKYNQLSRSALVELIYDLIHIEDIAVDMETTTVTENTVVTLYKTTKPTDKILREIGIEPLHLPRMDETTFVVTPDQMRKLQQKAPFLIAMQVEDFAKISFEQYPTPLLCRATIPAPTDEPIVGVIDTPFFDDVYFKQWVDYVPLIPDGVPVSSDKCKHGTAVSSIIVDGPELNPELDDGCGRFRVRHFGVLAGNSISTFDLICKIKQIVKNNPDIKVWNLSLGSIYEVQRSYVSPAAALLDKLQNELDVIFIVAGTNIPNGSHKKSMMLGSPADSLNSIVVNSVTRENNPADYTRTGPVLSFFHKPDVSYYGGVRSDPMYVCTHAGRLPMTGTSFAAPWIARKVAYLIHKMHLPREVAKALIIHSAAGWDWEYRKINALGYGVVPQNIIDILTTDPDEIRFVMYGHMDKQLAYSYDIPVPSELGKYYYRAKATLCYLPACTRGQGVDYPNTELQFKFGRVQSNKKGNPAVVSIDGNKQGEDDLRVLFEIDARNNFRKWDNTKHITDKLSKHSRPRSKKDNHMWGLQILTTDRTTTKASHNIPFAVVVTLKEQHGKNKYDEFMNLCRFKGWNVSEIDIDINNEIFASAQEDLELE